MPARVMVVEDEVLIRLAIAADLRAAGFLVIEARDAEEALDYLAGSADVDLVFTDVNIPGQFNGVDLARHLRTRLPRVPVILTSGAVNAESVRKLGAFFPKPYDPARVVKSICETLGLMPLRA